MDLPLEVVGDDDEKREEEDVAESVATWAIGRKRCILDGFQLE